MSNNLNDLYCFLNDDKENWSYVKILRGDLRNCVVKINHVSVASEENEDGTISINVNYDWIDEPKENISEEKITNIIGNIAADILQNHLL